MNDLNLFIFLSTVLGHGNFLVGNIPYGVNEEQLKEIFSGAGPVVSFRYMHIFFPLFSFSYVCLFESKCRIVYDRETGRPKGFGFCEFQDPESAQNAMRTLNGYEIGGRTLRVDNANRN